MWNRSFLILHGVENRRPAEHWQSDLAQRLREHGEQLFYPQLPDPNRPTRRLGRGDRGDHLPGAHELGTSLHRVAVACHRRHWPPVVSPLREGDGRRGGRADRLCGRRLHVVRGHAGRHGDPSIVRTCRASLTVVRGRRMPLPRQHRRAA
jgi:hypothetical protein